MGGVSTLRLLKRVPYLSRSVYNNRVKRENEHMGYVCGGGERGSAVSRCRPVAVSIYVFLLREKIGYEGGLRHAGSLKKGRKMPLILIFAFVPSRDSPRT